MNLHHIVEVFLANEEGIEDFFQERTRGKTPPLYLSCDIRNSGAKIGVIDTNLYPAGFNNLCNVYSQQATEAFRRYFQNYLPNAKRVALLIEEHTRNRYYLENADKLANMLRGAGLEVRLAYLGQEIASETIDLDLDDQRHLSLAKLQVREGKPWVQDVEVDCVVSNCDFSQGVPNFLTPILDRVVPSPNLGWHRRRKHRHFELLRQVVEDFSRRLDLDPWLLSTYFLSHDTEANTENFLEGLAEKTQSVLESIHKKFQQHQIEDAPYAFIKNDSGTYGMGMVDVASAEEVKNLNRKGRNKLFSAKGGQNIRSFLIQEGIPTADYYSGFPIEPVIYMVGFEPVGGFFRMNSEQNAYSSLNSRGMMFSCLCLHKIDEPHEAHFLSCQEKKNLLFLSKTLARLAALAAQEEFAELATEARGD